jgi:hypothetical protein
MLRLAVLTSVVIAAAFGGVAAAGSGAEPQKPTKEFRKAFEKVFTPPKLGRDFGAFAVLVANDVPTVSRYGHMRSPGDMQGFQTIKVDVVDGQLSYDTQSFAKHSVGTLLKRGEVVGIVHVGYGKGTVELSFETRRKLLVTRSEVGNPVQQQTEGELCTTVLRFRLPADLPQPATAAEVPAALEYVGAFLKAFPDEASAVAYSGSLE